MQGGWQPPPGGGQGYGAPTGYGQQPQGGYGGSPSMAPGPGYPQGNPYGGGAPPMMGGPGMYGNYEFNDTENAIIDKTAGRAKLWGIISTTLGALQLVGSCGTVFNRGLFIYFFTGIVAIIVGVSFMGVGNSLKAVVNTQGNDLVHMMQALDKLSGAFLVQIICAVVCFVFLALAFVIVAFVIVAAAASS